MITAFMILFAFQGVRMGGAKPGKPAAPDCSLLPGAECQHFANGITIFGKLAWPSDVTPLIIDVDLEDESGYVVDSVKSMPNNEFRFDQIPIVDSFDGHSLTYYIVINTDGLDIVRQQLSPTTNNFTGAYVTVPLRHPPGIVSRTLESVVSLDDLVREAPSKDVLSILDKAQADERKGDLKKAATDLHAALKLAPDSYEANLQMGLLDKKNHQYDEATQLLNHAVELNPASSRARVALGATAFDSKDYDKAADLLSQAVMLGSNSANVYFMLGASYYATEDFDNAEPALERALVISPGLGQANQELYGIYVKRGQLDKALGELQAYLSKHPNAPDKQKVLALSEKIQKTLHPQP